ncbi:rRNA cytosine-C5-methyltransferase, partial [Streptomyces sp. DT7]
APILRHVPPTRRRAQRRRPPAPPPRRQEDQDSVAPLQRGPPREALKAVRVGGVVGYATCSPHRAETRVVVEDVLKGRGGAPVEAEWV